MFFQFNSLIINLLIKSVPTMSKGYQWVVQLERQAVFKDPDMGWTIVSDPFSKRDMFFSDLEQAIFYCRQMGFYLEFEKKTFNFFFFW